MGADPLLAAVTEALDQPCGCQVWADHPCTCGCGAKVRVAVAPVGRLRDCPTCLPQRWLASIEAATDADRNGYDYVAAALKALKGER